MLSRTKNIFVFADGMGIRVFSIQSITHLQVLTWCTNNHDLTAWDESFDDNIENSKSHKDNTAEKR